jgi:hypothetical protein
MTLPICATTITATTPNGQPLAGAAVQAHLSGTEVYQGIVVPSVVSGTTNAQGQCVLNLWPNVLGSANSKYVVLVGGSLPDAPAAVVYARIPNQPACNIQDHTVSRNGGTTMLPTTVPAPAGFAVTKISNAVLRLSQLGDDGITRYEDLNLTQHTSANPLPPTMALLEPYRVGTSNVFKAVPWGDVTWTEGGSNTYSQVVDIYIPTVPLTGPFVVRDHAASSPYDIAEGSGLYNSLIAPSLAAGFVVFVRAARHPKLSSTPTNFYDTDYAVSLQFIRSLHQAIGFDPAKYYEYTQSRGSGCIINLLLPDLAAPTALTYAGRQSSRGAKLVWSINPQAFNRSQTMAAEYLTDQTQINLALADYPDDPRQRDAATLVATADLAAIPNFVAKYDGAFQAGKVTYAAMQAAGGVLHYPNQGLTYRAAYAARGLLDRIVLTDQDDGSANITADFVPTIQGLEAGLTLAQATAIARAARLGHSLIYIPPSLDGVSVGMDGSGGTPGLGQNIGGISDKSQGIANTNTTGGAGQGTNTRKPKLAAIGTQFGALFDSDDQLICQKANTGTPGFVAWTTTAMTTTLANQNTNQVVWSVGNGNTQTLAVVGADPLSKADRNTYVSLASAVAGADLFSTVTA